MGVPYMGVGWLAIITVALEKMAYPKVQGKKGEKVSEAVFRTHADLPICGK